MKSEVQIKHKDTNKKIESMSTQKKPNSNLEDVRDEGNLSKQSKSGLVMAILTCRCRA